LPFNYIEFKIFPLRTHFGHKIKDQTHKVLTKWAIK